ncbi:MAG: hypothetical protein FJY65_05195 [Calditrichaeota bacterium]|nr:hypothetical protein [Calditrichota bacterium]
MPEETEITPQELNRVLGKSKSKTYVLSAAGIAVASLMTWWFIGKSKPPETKPAVTTLILQPSEHTEDSSRTPFPEIETRATLPESAFDSLDITDTLLQLPSDSLGGLELPDGRSTAELLALVKTEVKAEEAAKVAGLTTDELIMAPLDTTLWPSFYRTGLTSADARLAMMNIDSQAIGRKYVSQVMDSASRRLDSLSQRLTEAQTAMATLSTDNLQLTERLSRLKGALDSTRTSEIKRLTKIIESMRPTQAAAMLRNRSTDDLTEILFKLKPRTAAAILQAMPESQAAEIAARVVRR